jgi:hypothetical protein
LDSGLPCFPQEYLVPWYSRSPKRVSTLSCTGLSPSLAFHSRSVLLERRFVTRWQNCNFADWALQPQRRIGLQSVKRRRFELVPFRSPLLRELFLFLGVLRCFSSPGALRLTYVFSQRYPSFAWVGSPIRVSLDITPAHGLPRAFRSVPRPSSAFSAKASTICS